MNVLTLLFGFYQAILFSEFSADYAECYVENYVTCNGLESRETDYLIYNHPEIQTVRLGLFVDDRIQDKSGYFVYFQLHQLNTIFEKSGVNIRVEYSFVQKVDVSSLSNDDIRDVFYELEDWEYSYIFSDHRELIYETRTDFIHLFLDNNQDWNGCGVARKFSKRYPYPVGLTACYSNRDIATWDPDQSTSTEYIFAHELGHQFGLEHDEPNASSLALIEGGYGLQVDESFGTIMSYAKNRVPYFSNSKLKINGKSYGNDNADAVRSLNELAPRLSRNFEEKIIYEN